MPSTPRPDGMPDAGARAAPRHHGHPPPFDDMCRRLATHGFAVVCARAVRARPGEVRADAEDAGADGLRRASSTTTLQLGDLAAAADSSSCTTTSRERRRPRLLHGRHATLKAAATGRVRPRGGVLRDDPRCPTLGGPGSASRSTPRPTCARRWRSSATPTPGRRPADIDALRDGVGRRARLRDRRLPGGRPRLRPRARPPRPPPRRRRRRLARASASCAPD